MKSPSFFSKKALWPKTLIGALLVATLVLGTVLPALAIQAPVVTAIAGGGVSGYALKSDGTVWAWGNGGYGQLGNNSIADSHVPVHVYGLAGITAIASGYFSGYALKSDGTVWAWGYNTCGELGNAPTYSHWQDTPIQVSGLTGVKAIAGGSYSGYALKSDGTVWAWGNNDFGKLGNNSTTDSHIPVQVSGLTNITAIDGGAYSGYALKSDGTVWAWGYNAYGQLGNNSTTYSHVPVQVSGLIGITAIAGGSYSGYALKSDGTVWAWGNNTYGGNGSNSLITDSHVPVQVSGLTGITAIAGGSYSGYALKSDGTVWAWGSNLYGELGNNSSTNYSRVPVLVPVQVFGLTGVTAIDGGGASGYALKSNGTVWAWGHNDAGQLGNNSTTDSHVPVQVSSLTDTEPIGLSDIAGHWAENNIKKMVALGAISGYPDGTFVPDNTITRAEFATLLVKAFKLELRSGMVFQDTAGHWAKDYISTAAIFGIANGYEDGSFGPDDLISREQIAVMVVKAAKLNIAGENASFADSGSISEWAKSYVDTAMKNGIMKGYLDNTFQPLGKATRAEAVKVIINAMK